MEMQAACVGFVVRTQGSGSSLPSAVTMISPAPKPDSPLSQPMGPKAVWPEHLLLSQPARNPPLQTQPCKKGELPHHQAASGTWKPSGFEWSVGVSGNLHPGSTGQDRVAFLKHPKQNLANAFASLSGIHIQKTPLFLIPS